MDDWRMGVIASTIANVMRGKGQKAYTPQDFMPHKAQMRHSVSNDVKKIFAGLKS